MKFVLLLAMLAIFCILEPTESKLSLKTLKKDLKALKKALKKKADKSALDQSKNQMNKNKNDIQHIQNDFWNLEQKQMEDMRELENDLNMTKSQVEQNTNDIDDIRDAIEVTGVCDEVSYAGQGNYWPVCYPQCAGMRQSPIDIDTSKVYDADEPSLEFPGYTNQNSLAGKCKNGGHSLKFVPEEGADLPGVKFDTNLTTYDLAQFHFHWGSTNDRGSEHTVDGQSFAMEMHLVHLNSQYDLDTALSKPDGLAVVGIMFVVGGDGSEFAPLQPIVDAAKALHDDPMAKVDTEVTLKDFLDMVGPGYYSYDGSLTTPTCNEVVTWFVMEGAITISQEQIDAFRGLSFIDSSPMVDNYRAPQPLNNRIVKRVVP